MQERRLLSTWKEIAAYLNRGVRTVQRWELLYRMPVQRLAPDSSVFAYADDIDAWLQRSKREAIAYVRPTVIVLDIVIPNALSDLKLALEGAKFNVLTAFSSEEVFATAARYDIDAFVIDSVLLEQHPSEIGREIKRLYPKKLLVLLGDDPVDAYDEVIENGNPRAVADCLIAKLGMPRLINTQ